jgi:type IV secretion system protein VirB9
MKNTAAAIVGLPLLLIPALATASGSSDPHLREVLYDPNRVVNLPVKRGVVTLVVLGADETITEIGTGLGADCAKADAAWCIPTQLGSFSLRQPSCMFAV